MAHEIETMKGAAVPAFRISRLLHAPVSKVFRAWTTAEHVGRWMVPTGVEISEVVVEPRVGGAFGFSLRFPDGGEQRVRGVIRELEPDVRLAVDLHVFGPGDRPLFWALTEADFTEALGGTRVDVVQSYREVEPALAPMISAGGSEGWGSMLDNLGKEVVTMHAGAGTGDRSAAHATFHLTRTYPAPVAKVWRALTVPEAKAKWFAGTPGEWEALDRHMDFRVGGTERLKGRWGGGVVSDFQAVFHDIVPNQRLIYSYVMHLNDRKISVSLATVELRPEGSGTTLAVTEQGVFLDGYDDAGSREHGTGLLLDALGASLAD